MSEARNVEMPVVAGPTPEAETVPPKPLVGEESAFLAFRVISPNAESSFTAHKFLGTHRKDSSTNLDVVAASAVFSLAEGVVKRQVLEDLSIPQEAKEKEIRQRLAKVLTPQPNEDRLAFLPRIIKFIADSKDSELK